MSWPVQCAISLCGASSHRIAPLPKKIALCRAQRSFTTVLQQNIVKSQKNVLTIRTVFLVRMCGPACSCLEREGTIERIRPYRYFIFLCTNVGWQVLTRPEPVFTFWDSIYPAWKTRRKARGKFTTSVESVLLRKCVAACPRPAYLSHESSRPDFSNISAVVCSKVQREGQKGKRL